MLLPTNSLPSALGRTIKRVAILIALVGTTQAAVSQDTPLISGGVGFLTGTKGGNTTYLPIIEPVLAAPLGPHLLIESRAALLESFSPNGGGQPGYSHSHFIGLTYLEGDYTALPHMTVVGGSFLLPFGTYNERLSPVWIGNFQDGPLIASLGLLSTGTGVGGMLRGSAVAHDRFSIDYAAWFSTRSGYAQFNSERSTGGRVSLHLPYKGLEAGLSYDRMLQGLEENFYGAHVWWTPPNTAFRLRSEFARGHHAQGYWVEADYRIPSHGGPDNWLGRIEPLFRMQQTFRRDTAASDGLPLVNVQRADFGLDYNLPHNARILTSYSRQFSANGNENVWETGIVYRILLPAWKEKTK
jgi:hypothetical protein